VVSPHWAESGLPRVATVYDLIPLRSPAHYFPSPAYAERYRARADWVAKSDLLLAISEHVRCDLLELLDVEPDRIATIGTGVSPYFSPPDGTDTELFRAQLPQLEGRPFVMTVSGSDIRKNTERLIAAFGELVRGGWDLQLLVVGDLDDFWIRRVLEAGRAARVRSALTLTGRIRDELLRACYRRAAVTVMPSLAEGFGLPVLEAAACGCPVLASSTSALAEAAATPVATFDPTSIDAIAVALAALLSDERRRNEVIRVQAALAARSTWPAVADRTAAAIDVMADRVHHGRWRSGKLAPRLALVGPVPPSGGGLGKYDSRLLSALVGRSRVDAVTPSLSRPDLPNRVGHVPSDAFGPTVRPVGYDVVVYAIGNSDGHLATALLALRHPGWLWLHEVRLPALATTALSELDDEAFQEAMAWLTQRSYPGRAPELSLRLAGRSVLDLLDAGVGLTPLLTARTRGVLVNSELARHLLLLDLPPMVHQPPIHVLPPACPTPSPSARRSTSDPEPLVVSLGVVSMAKRPDLLVDAAALVNKVRPCRLVFVGPCPPILAQVIADRSRLREVTDNVEVVGAVDEDAWRIWCDRAAVAVQLRDSSSGETSAAVLEALSRGLPVVTNLRSAADYPPGTVELVESCTPDVVATRLVDVLSDPGRQNRLAAVGLDFARQHSFENLADAMLAAVAG
jgi:glycosyltransferase involved in cell wall biosynthesis